MTDHIEDAGLDDDWDLIVEVTPLHRDGTRMKMFGSIDLIASEGMPEGRVRIFRGRIEPLTSDDLFDGLEELPAALDDDEDDEEYQYWYGDDEPPEDIPGF